MLLLQNIIITVVVVDLNCCIFVTIIGVSILEGNVRFVLGRNYVQ